MLLSIAERLKITKSKNSESFYIIDDFSHPQTNKHSTFIVKHLGSLDSLKEAHHVSSREEDSLYDGFYAVATDLEDNDLTLIIKSNKQRWE